MKHPVYSFIGTSLMMFMVLLSGCQKPPDEPRTYGWFDFVIPDSDTAQNVVDMSFLNEGIAGSSGYVTVKDGHFADGKGTPIRFFGTNLTFSSCFPEKKTAAMIAGRLRKLGMNVVRFHHMDNQPVPDGIWDKSMKKLDAGQLDKLDYLVYQLKIHGIYSNINTHVSRTYPGAEYEKIEQFSFGKTIDQFYRPYINMQKNYARDLLTHRNPYTGTTYADEAAVAFVEVNNENSLLSNWSLLPGLKPDHKSELIRMWNSWLSSSAKYHGNITGNDDLMGIIRNYDKATETQKEMLWSFLVDTEMAYAREMTGYFKNDLMIHALLCESQAYYSGVAGVIRESETADFIDMHAYWEHPDFPGQSWSSTDWLIRNSSMVSNREGGTLLWFAQHRVAGMPLTISEYDHPAPTFYCAEMFPMLNSLAAFQDFDGIYHFTFDPPYDGRRIDNFFSSAGHPLKQVFVPVGASLFRMNAIKPGLHTVQLELPPEALTEKLVRYGDKLFLHESNMKNLWNEAGAPDALVILHPMNVNTKGKDFRLSEPVEKPAGPWISETGEITWDNRDSSRAVYTVNAPAAKAAVGYIGGKQFNLGNVTIAMDTTPFNWAVITVTALDGKPLESSGRILLVAAGRVENSGWKWNQDKTSVGGDWGNAPTRAEGIPALLTFREMDDFHVRVLDPAGNPGPEVPVRIRRGDQSFGIGAQYETLWYILTRE